MQKIAGQIDVVRKELDELEQTLPNWESSAKGKTGSDKYRSIAERIVLSAKHLQTLVKENTFSR